MRKTSRIVIFAAFGCIGSAQSALPTGARTPAEDAAVRQRQVTAAMEESLAKQRAAAQKQPLQHQSSGFFVLPPPAPLGATVPAPAVADCPPLPGPEVDALIADAAKREDLEVDLLQSVAKQESGFRPCAVSAKGAMGLMQLMPATAEQYAVKDPFDPAENVNAGAKLLKQLLKRYNGDRSLALGAYNAGPAAVDAAEGIPQLRETIDYISRILSFMGR